ncbi:hypothetical protein GCM10020219_074850 [Nonomuraea dietziae]
MLSEDEGASDLDSEGDSVFDVPSLAVSSLSERTGVALGLRVAGATARRSPSASAWASWSAGREPPARGSH